MNIRFYCTARSKRECAYWQIVSRKDRCGGCTIYMRGEFSSGVCNIDSCNNFAPVCEHAIHGECTSEMCKANAMVREMKSMGLKAEITGLEKVR